MTPMLGIMASGISGNLWSPGTDFDSITGTVTVGAGGASSITFSSIPATYKHLQIRCIARDTGTLADWNLLSATFNGDTAANYSSHGVRAYGATADIYPVGFANASNMEIGLLPSSFSGYGTSYAATVFEILDYSNTNKYKTFRSINGSDTNSATYGYANFGSGNWRSTTAVSSITISAVGRTLAQHSHFALYGIKG
jgi:hypothetical protein